MATLSATGSLSSPNVVATPLVEVSNTPTFADTRAVPNTWFNHFQNPLYNNDRDLYDTLHAESINIHGATMVYYSVSYDTSYDPLFGEDDDRRIRRKFPIKAAFELPPEIDQYTNFEIEGLDNFQMFISKKHFTEASQYNNKVEFFPVYPPGNSDLTKYPSIRPNAGDIIKSLHNDIFYEVLEVMETAEQFLQYSHTWTLQVRPLKNEHLGLSATTSADMDTIRTDVIEKSDIFDKTDYITSAEDDVLYDPPGSETDSEQDPLYGW